MADKVNIKNLSTADEIKSGQYIILETDDGTKILDYKDFIIGQDNITFQPLLSSHTTDIGDLSSSQASVVADIATFNTIVSNVSALSGIQWKGEWNVSSTYKKPDAVFSGSSSFIAIAPVPAGSSYSPLDSSNVIRSAYWQYLAKGGVPTLATKGAMLQGTGTGAVELAPGSSGYILKSQGSGASLTWATPNATRPTCKALPTIGATDKKAGRDGVYLSFMYLMSDGTVRSSGEAYAAMRGYHSVSSSGYGDKNPQPVMMPADYDYTNKTITSIEFSYNTAFLIDNDGVVYAGGHNNVGQLGVNDTSHRYVFEKISKYYEQDNSYFTDSEVQMDRVLFTTDDWINGYCTFFITKNLGSAPNDGRIYATGHNTGGQLGTGGTSTSTKPIRCGTINSVDKFWVTGSDRATCFAVTTDGKFWAWGDYNPGYGNSMGNNVQTDVHTPQQQNASGFTPGDATTTALHGVTKLLPTHGSDSGNTRRGTTFALLSTGHVYSCGDGQYGQIGIGGTVAANTSWTLAHGVSAAIDIDAYVHGTTGSCHATCSAIEGGSFNQTTLKYEGFTDLSDVGGTYHDSVTQSKGRKIVAWGYNGHSHLGTGNTTQQNTPFVLTEHSNFPSVLSPAVSAVWVQSGARQYGQWTSILDLSGNMWCAGYEDMGKFARGGALYPSGTSTGHAHQNTFMRTSLPVDWSEVKEFRLIVPRSAENQYNGAPMILTHSGKVFVAGAQPARWAGTGRMDNDDGWTAQDYWAEVRF